jgi:hypothetical protein
VLCHPLCSFHQATIIFLDLQIKIPLLILEFVSFYLRGVQLMSLIILSIGSLNQYFVNIVNEQNKSVPMDVDRVVVVQARDDMEIDNNPVDVDNDL